MKENESSSFLRVTVPDYILRFSNKNARVCNKTAELVLYRQNDFFLRVNSVQLDRLPK